MALLYLCLLFSAAFGPSSAEEECNGTTAVYVAPGGSALLQVTDSERAFCRGRCLFEWRRRRGFRSVAEAWIPSSITPCKFMPDCRVLPGGSLELSRITPEQAGGYTLLMRAGDPDLMPRIKCFLLQLQEVCTGSTDMVYAALGGSFLLQITDSERAPCPGACDFKWTKDGDLDVAMVKSRGSFTWRPYSPSCQVFSNGSLELSRITPSDAGYYSVHMDNGSGRNFRKCFLLHLLGEPESVWERVIFILRVILIAITLVAGIFMVRWHFA